LKFVQKCADLWFLESYFMRILAVTTLRNEAPFIVEWVAHMRAIGVTDLLVYTNDCDDGTDALLAVLANHGILHHIIQDVPQGVSPQWQALKAAWWHPLRRAASSDCGAARTRA
jgi:hypothetical protein